MMNTDEIKPENSDELKKFESNTLEEAYFDRNQVVLAFAKMCAENGLKVGWNSEKQPDWPVLLIDLPTGQVSWHIPREMAEPYEIFAVHPMDWDGHDLQQKRERMNAFLGRSSKPPEGE